MAITTEDRIAALEIACRAEHEAVARAERADNGAAAEFNRQRLLVAENRLSAAKLDAGDAPVLEENFFANPICTSPGENLIDKVRSERATA